MRVRIAGGLLAFPRKDDPNLFTLPGLWGARPGGDPGWTPSEGGTQGCDCVRGCPLLELVPGHPLFLKHHEPLQVGSACPKLGQVRSLHSGGNHSPPGSCEALFRAVLPQASGPGLGVSKSGIQKRHCHSAHRDWENRSLLAEV
jgi:hypothetical protein